jgi:ribonucleotide reductase alpha subunit
MNIAYHSEEAKIINKNIFETIYHAALEKSWEISVERRDKILEIKNMMSSKIFDDIVNEEIDKPLINYFSEPEVHICNPILAEIFTEDCYAGAYSSFKGSPAFEGKLQFDLWNVDPTNNRYDWDDLKEKIKRDGIRNSLLLAPMPTASTSQILGFNECFEPFTSNIYSRRTLAGEFILPNKYLIRELIDLGVWNEDLKNNIILNKGSIQHLNMIPIEIREKYKIVWEIPMKHLIDMSADRGAFICQSQSLNLWLEDPNYSTLTSMHFYSWNKGLKTGIYYLRRKAKHQAQQFTIEPTMDQQEEEDKLTDCELCSA